MKRKALLIYHPGEGSEGDEDYLPGVFRDASLYRRFLMSAVGGSWKQNEILPLESPARSDVRREIQALSAYDYSFVAFFGHGYFDEDKNASMVSVHDGVLSESALSSDCKKQTLILDSCRKITRAPTLGEATKLAAFPPKLDGARCRRLFDEGVEECGDMMVTLYACGEDEYAYEERGGQGIYSSSLIRAAETWSRGKDPDNESVLSIIQAHLDAASDVRHKTNERQSPDMRRPRTGPYFPFAVVA